MKMLRNSNGLILKINTIQIVRHKFYRFNFCLDDYIINGDVSPGKLKYFSNLLSK